MRSAIVHSRKKNMDVTRRREAFDKGFDLARWWLFRLLREGPSDDWGALVVDGSYSEGCVNGGVAEQGSTPLLGVPVVPAR